jgi:hypothetical protein
MTGDDYEHIGFRDMIATEVERAFVLAGRKVFAHPDAELSAARALGRGLAIRL